MAMKIAVKSILKLKNGDVNEKTNMSLWRSRSRNKFSRRFSKKYYNVIVQFVKEKMQLCLWLRTKILK